MYITENSLRIFATTSRKPAPRTRITSFFRSRRDYDRLLNQPDYLIRDVGLTRQKLTQARNPWSLLLGAIL